MSALDYAPKHRAPKHKGEYKDENLDVTVIYVRPGVGKEMIDALTESISGPVVVSEGHDRVNCQGWHCAECDPR